MVGFVFRLGIPRSLFLYHELRQNDRDRLARSLTNHIDLNDVRRLLVQQRVI